MKNLKRFILIVICLIIIIIIALIIFIKKGKDNEEITKKNNIVAATGDLEETVDIKEIHMPEYMLIKNCVNQYLEALTKKSNKYLVQTDTGYEYRTDEKELKTTIYAILDDAFIKEEGITSDNILQKVNIVSQKRLFIPTEIATLNNEAAKKVIAYKVKGRMYEEVKSRKSQTQYYILNICSTNKTFSIIPISEEKYSKDVTSENIPETIEKKGYNRYTEPEAGWQEIAGEYFDICKKMMLLSPEYVFDKMPKEYREKRFIDIEGFKKYINSNLDRIAGLEYTRYSANENNNNEYIAQDQYENTYIFEEKDVNDYTILMDIYTVPIKQFVEKYNAGDDKVKLAMNIENIISAINNKDYNYVYSHLNETFKKNSVKNIENLQRYIDTNLFDMNETKDETKIIEEGNRVYSCELTVKSKYDENKTKKMTIIMRLKEGTDYEMSFNVG